MLYSDEYIINENIYLLKIIYLNIISFNFIIINNFFKTYYYISKHILHLIRIKFKLPKFIKVVCGS